MPAMVDTAASYLIAAEEDGFRRSRESLSGGCNGLMDMKFNELTHDQADACRRRGRLPAHVIHTCAPRRWGNTIPLLRMLCVLSARLCCSQAGSGLHYPMAPVPSFGDSQLSPLGELQKPHGGAFAG
jgi:hypothetical protein